MSIDAAKDWFNSHPHEIPALDANLSEIITLLDEEHQTHNLVKYAVRDPGLILAILKKINAGRGPSSGKDVVESPQAALSMMGSHVTQTLFREFPIAENTLKDDEQIFLFQQITNRSYHNQFQAEYWGKENGFKQLDKLQLAALLAFTGELLCCIYDYEKYKDYALAGSTNDGAHEIFGFHFPELTETICESLNLPELISMLQPHTENVSQTSKLLHFTSRLCQSCEHGWYTEDVSSAFQEYVDYFQIPLDKVISKSHEIAVIASRKSYIKEAWHVAGRLILIKDEVWKPKLRAKAAQQQSAAKPNQPSAQPSKASQATAQPQVQESAVDKIKRLVVKPGVSQSELLTACVHGIHQDAGMGKVALMLISKDKHFLQNRMTLGIDNEAPFKKFTIKIEESGLLKILLNKPTAIWINADTIVKYKKIIPLSLLSEINTNNFCAMSLFIAEKPVGIIYADRSNATKPLDNSAFNQFKQLITLASKALTLVAKKQQSK